MIRNFIRNLIVILLILCVLSTISFYTETTILPFKSKITYLLDLPLARINDDYIGIRQFEKELEIIRSIDEESQLSETELRSKIWEKIKEEYAIRQMAVDLSIKWSRSDLLEYTSRIFSADEEETMFKKYSRDHHFLYHTILPQLLRDKLTKELVLAENSDERSLIDTIYLQSLPNSKNFSQLLEEYLQLNNLKFIDTEIILAANQLPEAEYELFRSLVPGQITPIIASYDGYRIYRIINYFTEPEEAWQLAEFFVPSNAFERTLTEYIEQLTTSIYAKGIV